eukprot:Rmarinus@m.2967
MERHCFRDAHTVWATVGAFRARPRWGRNCCERCVSPRPGTSNPSLGSVAASSPRLRAFSRLRLRSAQEAPGAECANCEVQALPLHTRPSQPGPFCECRFWAITQLI